MGHTANKNKLTESQRLLVEENWLLIFVGMRKYYRPHWKIDREEMKSVFGHMLCRAAQTYKKEKSSFTTWAFWWFYKGYLDLIRDRDRKGITGSPKAKTNYLSHDRDVSRMESSAQLTLESIQIDSPAGRRAATERRRQAELMEMREAFELYSKDLDARQKEVMRRRMEGESFISIGESMGIAKQRVEQVQKRAIEVIRWLFTRRGG